MEIAALILAVAVGWFWLDTLQARDVALKTGQDACHAEGVQFLDWTVAQERVRLQRNDDGQVRLLRVYRFEYSETGNDRFDGSVTLLGRSVLSVRLAPRPALADNVIPLR